MTTQAHTAAAAAHTRAAKAHTRAAAAAIKDAREQGEEPDADAIEDSHAAAKAHTAAAASHARGERDRDAEEEARARGEYGEDDRACRSTDRALAASARTA